MNNSYLDIKGACVLPYTYGSYMQNNFFNKTDFLLNKHLAIVFYLSLLLAIILHQAHLFKMRHTGALSEML